MSIYKKIKNEDLTTYTSEVFKSLSLTSSDDGIGVQTFNSTSGALDNNSSYYYSLLHNFYLSGSDYALSESRYENPYHMTYYYNHKNQLHVNKFHNNKYGHIYKIPQNYFGEYIKPGTFTMTESGSLIIKDDKFGNLYISGAQHYPDNSTAESSSTNYVGNIFYQSGVVTFTETGSNEPTYNTQGFGGFGNVYPLGQSGSMAISKVRDENNSSINMIASSMYISPDGTKYWWLGYNGDDTVYEMTLSTPWDISTATKTAEKAINYTGENAHTEITFAADGKYMYAVGTTLDTIVRWTLATPWDITTATKDSMTLDLNDGVLTSDTGRERSPQAMWFSPDGKHFYVGGTTNSGFRKFNYWNMSTPFDLTTATWKSYLSPRGVAGAPGTDYDLYLTGFWVTPDGKYMFSCGQGISSVNKYVFDTPWDLSTMYLQEHIDVTSTITGGDTPQGISLSPSGHKLYIQGVLSRVYEYDFDVLPIRVNNLGTDYSIQFSGSKEIITSEYKVTVEPNEFNLTNNPSIRSNYTGSTQTGAHVLAAPLSASNWSPYFNTIGFYDDNNDLLMVAKWPQNIKTRQDIPLILKVKMDW